MDNLTYEKIESIGILRINRPKILNVLNTATLDEFRHFLEVTAIQEKLKALIITGTGDKAFIAGADVREMQKMNRDQIIHFCGLGQQVANILESAPFITIAAVNGFALGGGLEMALACDFIYASRNARLGFPEVMLGLIPGFGGTQRLMQAIGARFAKEMIISGKSISPDHAKDLGLINGVYDHQSLIELCLENTKEILTHSFTAIIHAKKAINYNADLNLLLALEIERNDFVKCFESIESRTVITNFLEKKKGTCSRGTP